MSLEITVNGLDEAIAWFDQASEDIRVEVQRAFEQIGQDIADYCRSIANVKTGAYQGSFYSRVTGEWQIAVGNFDRKAAWIEFGTPPHLIFAKNAEALHFFLEDGTEIFAKYVHHPGTMPYLVLHRGLMYFKDNIVQMVADAVHRAKPT